MEPNREVGSTLDPYEFISPSIGGWAKYDPHDTGWCAYDAFREDRRQAAIVDLGGRYPCFEKLVYRLFREPDMNYSKKGRFTYSKEGHILHFDPDQGCLMKELMPFLTTNWCKMKQVRVGVLVSEVVNTAGHLSASAVGVLRELLEATNDVAADAAANYSRLGDKIEEINHRGGFREVAGTQLTSIFAATIGRWATPGEMYAVAKALTQATLGDDEWSIKELHTALEQETETSFDMQTRLGNIMGAFLVRQAGVEWGNWKGRRKMKLWRSSFVGNARGFARAWCLNEDQIEKSLDRALETGAEWVVEAGKLLKTHGVSALTVAAKVAGAVSVTAALVVAAGVVLDWYYVDKDLRKLGPVRESHSSKAFASYSSVATDLAAVASLQSDEAYNIVDNPNTVRIDPFYFYVKKDMQSLRDETAMDKLLANAVATPLINTVQSRNKRLILVPATIPHESMQHIQSALPNFYYRVVDRHHTHPELWVVRRAFEMMIAQRIAASHVSRPVVVIGGSVRQVAKFPRVVANYGPKLTGRDDSRQRLEGTASQQAFFNAVNKPIPFSFTGGKYSAAMAVAPFSVQDITKREFALRCIYKGITEAAVCINIPVIMMDHRISVWDDNVLNVRYERRDGKLYMTPLNYPVNGYCNPFAEVMSWVEPIDPIPGYDIVVEVDAQVSSCYLLKVKIGRGRQEEHTTLWKMPDAGYYVLQDLTREESGFRFFTTPAQKFDQVVKFLIHLPKSKDLIEAAAGRIAGLEAPIKLGGVTLERAWELDHRMFASVLVHAICCAAVDKDDARESLAQLSEYYAATAIGQRGLLEKARKGWLKFFGADKDSREVVKSRLGASDYDPVTHWTCWQCAGDDAATVEFDETKLEKVVKPADAKNAKPAVAQAEDSGYESDSKSESVVGEQPVVAPEQEPVEFSGFGPLAGALRVVVSDEQYDKYHTTSKFEPDMPYRKPTNDSSRGHVKFKEALDKVAGVKDLVVGGKEFACPDSGVLEIVEMAIQETAGTVAAKATRFMGFPEGVQGTDRMEKVQDAFYKATSKQTRLRSPSLLLDGIAGSAKSSVIRSYVRKTGVKMVIVTPSRRLKRDWVRQAVGKTVTQHMLRPADLKKVALVAIDEVYAYDADTLAALLHMITASGKPYVLLGDRMQQYEDGSQITSTNLRDLGGPCIRFVVSNTCPVDAMVVISTVTKNDPFAELFQTRNSLRHSIFFVDNGDLAYEAALVKYKYSNTLNFKDRADTELGWPRAAQDYGFTGATDLWDSVSRVQGVRTEYSFLFNTANSKTERWYSNQRGLLYVAVSRHSKGMLFSVYRSDIAELGLETEVHVPVAGRLVMKSKRERFEAPYTVKLVQNPSRSDFLTLLYQRGGVPQVFKHQTFGPIVENWRPWFRADANSDDSVLSSAAYAALGLWSSKEPYARTRAAQLPLYRAAMGLWTLRRPNIVETNIVDAVFKGLDRLAVQQSSKDELLDQKNVVERAARPRIVNLNPPESLVNYLYEGVKEAYFDYETEKDWAVEPCADDWASTRTAQFKRKFEDSVPYGTTRSSVVSDGFLKTQVKVKLKAAFALEENYGQTVLATPADYNAIFGPWSKMFLRNVRLATRRGVILDSGYSDKEVAREWRRLGVLGTLAEENYQSDVSRQDTSHTAVTLRVFARFAKDFNVPEELVDLYVLHSTKFEYRSLHAGLYRGQALLNLGSGDPFTLIRNIFEVMTVMVERYEVASLKASCAIVKGDDYLANKLPVRRDLVLDPDIRATVLKEDINAPPYHAGRFFLPDDVVPDPIRMVVKAFVRKTDDPDRANQLHEAFYDRYLPVQAVWRDVLENYCLIAYSDFDPALIRSLLSVYIMLENRQLFFDLISMVPQEKRLVVYDPEDNCVEKCLAWFTTDQALISRVKNLDFWPLLHALASSGIPVFTMRGDPSDMKRRGIWLSHSHAVAVVSLTEFNDAANLEIGQDIAANDSIGSEFRFGDLIFERPELQDKRGSGGETVRSIHPRGFQRSRTFGAEISDGAVQSELVENAAPGPRAAKRAKRD